VFVSVLPSPRLSAHPVDVGARTEGAILAELLRRGYDVLVPFGTNQRYDLVLAFGARFVRVQCKTAQLHDGFVLFSARSVRSNRRGSYLRPYTGEIELFMAYCAANGRVYAVPIEDATRSEVRLRLSPTANGQAKHVRWARDYELGPPSSIGRALHL
jgi:hypothetical protein